MFRDLKKHRTAAPEESKKIPPSPNRRHRLYFELPCDTVYHIFGYCGFNVLANLLVVSTIDGDLVKMWLSGAPVLPGWTTRHGGLISFATRLVEFSSGSGCLTPTIQQSLVTVVKRCSQTLTRLELGTTSNHFNALALATSCPNLTALAIPRFTYRGDCSEFERDDSVLAAFKACPKLAELDIHELSGAPLSYLLSKPCFNRLTQTENQKAQPKPHRPGCGSRKTRQTGGLEVSEIESCRVGTLAASNSLQRTHLPRTQDRISTHQCIVCV
jgi:hypothetical protein